MQREDPPGSGAGGGAARRAAFAAIAIPLAGALRGVARRETGRADLADDLVQETFLRAYRTFDSFEPGTNARAWLFTILYSVCVNHRRRDRVHAAQSIEEFEERFGRPLVIQDPTAQAAIEEQPSLSWEGSAAERALAALPDSFRTAVELVDLAELTYEEAAQVLQCPVGTLRSRLFRGRRALATALGAVVARGDGG